MSHPRFSGVEAERLPFEEERKRQRVQRYHALVDEKFLQGLTPEETLEVRQLGEEIDAANAPSYATILERLRVR